MMEQLTQFAPLLMFVVIYFMIRPQQKKLKTKESFKVGDKIITKSGLHGKVSSLQILQL
jgi:preprotein translocase subunit YajC